MNSTEIEMAPESFSPGAEVAISMSSRACTGILIELNVSQVISMTIEQSVLYVG